MPANKKYFSSTGQRILKITAGFVGGYLVTLSIHQFLLTYCTRKPILATAHFSTFILWGALMVIAFLSKNGWRIWLWYLLATLLFALPFILNLL